MVLRLTTTAITIMRNNFVVALSILAYFGLVQGAFGCDPCSLYSASRIHGTEKGSWSLSVSEQYTNYQKTDEVKENSIKDGELVEGFSTTQVVAGYDVTDNSGVQVTIPVILRSFKKIENFRVEDDHESGIGDMTLSATHAFYNDRSPENATVIGGLLGVKLPTGDTGTLRDISTGGVSAERASFLRHHVIGTGGRVLSIGSGSYDVVFGTYGLIREQRTYLLADIQYTLRTEGDFDYEFADDLLWSVGPGYYLMLDHDFSAALRVVVSGEHKGNDHHEGAVVNNSNISNLYVGPEVLLTFNETTGVQIGADARVTEEDQGAQVAANFRLKAAVSYRF